jgi:hypothetical protein
MIATSGDEAFVMLSEFPRTALALFGLLFLFGILFGWISDKFISLLGLVRCESCVEPECAQCVPNEENSLEGRVIFSPHNIIQNVLSLSFTRFLLLVLIGSFVVLVVLGTVGPTTWNWKRITFSGLSVCSLYITAVCSEHYLHAHIWDHIVKKHLFRIFLWTAGALLFVHLGLALWNLETFVRQHMMWVLLIGAFLGIIPESGPHLTFVMLYAQGLVPFSVLLTTSFVQDGHGMLPLLSYSIKDVVLIKAFNLAFGVAIGAALFGLGF